MGQKELISPTAQIRRPRRQRYVGIMVARKQQHVCERVSRQKGENMGSDASGLLNSKGSRGNRWTAGKLMIILVYSWRPQGGYQRFELESIRINGWKCRGRLEHTTTLLHRTFMSIQTNNIHELEYAEDLEYLREQCFSWFILYCSYYLIPIMTIVNAPRSIHSAPSS